MKLGNMNVVRVEGEELVLHLGIVMVLVLPGLLPGLLPDLLPSDGGLIVHRHRQLRPGQTRIQRRVLEKIIGVDMNNLFIEVNKIFFLSC